MKVEWFHYFSKLDYLILSVFLFLVVTKPPYEITETGWGEFEIIIKIFFIDPNERPVSSFPNALFYTSDYLEEVIFYFS